MSSCASPTSVLRPVIISAVTIPVVKVQCVSLSAVIESNKHDIWRVMVPKTPKWTFICFRLAPKTWLLIDYK